MNSRSLKKLLKNYKGRVTFLGKNGPVNVKKIHKKQNTTKSSKSKKSKVTFNNTSTLRVITKNNNGKNNSRINRKVKTKKLNGTRKRIRKLNNSNRRQKRLRRPFNFTSKRQTMV